MRVGWLFAVGLAAVVLATWSAEAQPRKSRDLICAEITQERARAQEPLSARNLNFFLFDAAAAGCDSLVLRFLDEGASIQARDRFGNSALSIAARMGKRSTVETLLELGSDVEHRNLLGSSVLLRAVTANRRRTVAILLEAGADPNVANNRGVTPLIAAAFNGEGRMLDMLLQAGADPGVTDATGKGPIVYAAARGYARMVERLLAAGVDVNAVYDNDLTALMWAAGHTNDAPEAEGLATVEALVGGGAEVDRVDARGRSALMIAAERGHALIAARLMELGANPDRTDVEGATALTLAASEKVARVLRGEN